jgi:hypothetical protein
MKLKFLLIITMCFSIANGQKKEVQYIKKGDFPPGIYLTIDDVLNKKPSSTEELYFKGAVDTKDNENPEKVFFYLKEKDKKVRIPVGVSHKGEMYFQTYRKYTNKKDKGYDPDAYSRFCKVTNYGRFIYFEEDMKGIWTKGLLANLGPAGYSISGKIKGIILDLENKEFNMLRNCEDLNDFLKLNEIQEVNCNSNKFTIGNLRTTIEEINQPYR